MFKKPREATEGEQLRDALSLKDTKISVIAKNGKRWTFVNDTMAECTVQLSAITVTETPSKMDVITRFKLEAKNGRLG